MANYIRDIRDLVGHRPLILAASSLIIQNEQGELLLQRRSDSGNWGLPGGFLELGESFEQAAHRELYEETGMTCERVELLRVLSGEAYYYTYPNGDQVYGISAVHRVVNPVGEMKGQDGESLDLKYFPLQDLPLPDGVSKKIVQGVRDLIE